EELDRRGKPKLATSAEWADWNTRIAAMSYYLYGEVLDMGVLSERLKTSSVLNLYFLDSAILVFGDIAELALKNQGKFTYEQLFARFREHQKNLNVQFEEFPFEDAYDPIRLNLGSFVPEKPDYDDFLLQRALNIALGNIPGTSHDKTSHSAAAPETLPGIFHVQNLFLPDQMQ